MVMLTNSSRQVNSLPFSFAADLVGESQRVDVELAKFDYPGEIIVAEEWRPECQCEQITVLDSPPQPHRCCRYDLRSRQTIQWIS